MTSTAPQQQASWRCASSVPTKQLALFPPAELGSAYQDQRLETLHSLLSPLCPALALPVLTCFSQYRYAVFGCLPRPHTLDQTKNCFPLGPPLHKGQPRFQTSTVPVKTYLEWSTPRTHVPTIWPLFSRLRRRHDLQPPSCCYHTILSILRRD